MRKKFFSTLILALILMTGAPLGAQQPPPTPPPAQKEQGARIVITSDFVNVVFTVVNRRQRFVTDLEKNNFKIKAGGSANKFKGDHYGEIVASEVMFLDQYPKKYYDDDAEKTDASIFARAVYSPTENADIIVDLQ